MNESPWLTGELSAGQRAFHFYHGSKPLVFSDPYSVYLCGDHTRAKLLEVGAEEAYAKDGPFIAHQLARSRYVEERLYEIPPEQYVIIGAGMDSFVYRKPYHPAVVFEVDHPMGQEIKRERLEKLKLEPPANLRYVPIDLETGDLQLELEDSGFQQDKRTLFSMMGVVPFLTKGAFMDVLEGLSGAPGSEIIFDVIYPSSIDEKTRGSSGQRVVDSVASVGCRISAYGSERIKVMLWDAGIRTVEVIGAEKYRKWWFEGREDGLEPWDGVYTVRAEIIPDTRST